MDFIKKYLGDSRVLLIGLAVIFASAGIAQATVATTIGANVSTTGTLSVTGLSTFLGGATTTQLTLLSGDTIKNTTASTTIMSGTLAPDLLSVAGASVLTGGATVGSTGATAITFIKKGTCNLYSGSSIVSIAATSTVTLDCQAGVAAPSVLTSVTSGDTVFMQAPATMPTTYLGLRIVGAVASSTTGYIQVVLWNGTGAAYTLASAATSSLQYLDIR